MLHTHLYVSVLNTPLNVHNKRDTQVNSLSSIFSLKYLTYLYAFKWRLLEMGDLKLNKALL